MAACTLALGVVNSCTYDSEERQFHRSLLSRSVAAGPRRGQGNSRDNSL